MFLNRLNTSERESFLSLALLAAEANGVVEAEEYAMMEEYCREMGIAFFDARKIKSFEKVAALFKESTIEIKRIVILEIIGLMNADGAYDDQEKAFVQKLAQAIGVSEVYVSNLSGLIDRYLDLVREMAIEVSGQ